MRAFCRFCTAVDTSSYCSALPAYLQYFCALVKSCADRVTPPGGGRGKGAGEERSISTAWLQSAGVNSEAAAKSLRAQLACYYCTAHVALRLHIPEYYSVRTECLQNIVSEYIYITHIWKKITVKSSSEGCK